jgi:pyruvate ferredoxin oxidoreductase alpha subunit
MDGFILTHAYERVDVPTQAEVAAFLPPFEPRQVLDPDDPMTIGAMVGPEAFMEVRYLMHAKQRLALETIPRIAGEFEAAFGRASGGLVRGYRLEDADTVVVALGSVLGTIEDVIDEMREDGEKIGALAIKCFRPWPADEVREALNGAKRVIVLEKAFAVGAGGIVGQNVRLALTGLPIEVNDVVAGLGGRPITKPSLHKLFREDLDPQRLTFLDMDWELVKRELERAGNGGQVGPHAENILKDIGMVAGGSH